MLTSLFSRNSAGKHISETIFAPFSPHCLEKRSHFARSSGGFSRGNVGVCAQRLERRFSRAIQRRRPFKVRLPRQAISLTRLARSRPPSARQKSPKIFRSGDSPFFQQFFTSKTAAFVWRNFGTFSTRKSHDRLRAKFTASKNLFK